MKNSHRIHSALSEAKGDKPIPGPGSPDYKRATPLTGLDIRRRRPENPEGKLVKGPGSDQRIPSEIFGSLTNKERNNLIAQVDKILGKDKKDENLD